MAKNDFQAGMVSTVIPVYNRSAMVVRAIDSVLSQSYRPIEILVVDDGSTDDTPDALERLSKEHPEIRVLRQVNAGPGVAREHGRQHIRGEFVQYLDSDDVLLPNKFSAQIALLNSSSKAGVAYGKTARVELGENPASLVPWKGTGTAKASMFPDFLRSRWWGTSTPLYRRKVVNEVGPWLPLINEEDWEYDCRVAALALPLVFVDDFVSVQYRHDDHLSDEGTVNATKLEHRCIAREGMYQSAVRYNMHALPEWCISAADRQHFSKSVFLLARECAAQGMVKQARKMLSLAIKINKKKTIKHRLFKGIVNILGWQKAARLVNRLGR